LQNAKKHDIIHITYTGGLTRDSYRATGYVRGRMGTRKGGSDRGQVCEQQVRNRGQRSYGPRPPFRRFHERHPAL